jgi:hypothetical protein
MKIGFITLSIIILLSSCASYKALTEVRDDFDRRVREYNNLLSSEKFEQAGSLVVESHRGDFNTRANAARNVQVIDYQILSITDEIQEKGAATANVQINYTIPPSSEIKTVVDSQNWSYVYVKEEGRKRWCLMTLLPEFK